MPDNEILESELVQIAVDTRKFEIGLFWTRSLFFAGFLSAAAYGLLNLSDRNMIFYFPLCLFGMTCSSFWVIANRGSKFWQENWEKKADKKTNNFFNNVLAQEKRGFITAAAYSVSKLVMLLSYYITFAWHLIALRYLQSILSQGTLSETQKIYPLVMILNYIFIVSVIFVLGRSNEKSFGRCESICQRQGLFGYLWNEKLINSAILCVALIVMPIVTYKIIYGWHDAIHNHIANAIKWLFLLK